MYPPTNQWTRGGQLIERLKGYVDHCRRWHLAQGDTVLFTSLIWDQLEAEIAHADRVAVYDTYLEDLYRDVIQITNNPNLNMYIRAACDSQTFYTQGQIDAMEAKQVSFAATYSRVYTYKDDSATTSDGVHFNGAGYLRISDTLLGTFR